MIVAGHGRLMAALINLLAVTKRLLRLYVLQRVFDTPLMILESKLQTILTVLALRAEFRMEVPGNLDVPKPLELQTSLQGLEHRVSRSKTAT